MAAADPFDSYMAEIRGLPVADLAMEVRLLQPARDGDEHAMRELIEGHLLRAAELGVGLAPDWMSPLDAVQEANLVLMRLLSDASVPSPLQALPGAIRRHLRGIRPPS